MPSLRKLPVQPSNILKRGRDLTVFSVPSPLSLDVTNDFGITTTTTTTMIQEIETLFGKENGYPDPSPSSPPARKRQRLDHLSQEEKIMRRKLKNRVAAQSARDRKKARMTELEEQVELLERQKLLLQMDNKKLRKQNDELEVQNAELRIRLALSEKKSSECQAVSATETSDLIIPDVAKSDSKEGRSLEYASLINDPLLKEQDLQILALLMTRYVYLPMVARLLIFLMYFNVVAMNCCSAVTPVQPNSKHKKAIRLNYLVKKWWGAHQKAWNPSKN